MSTKLDPLAESSKHDEVEETAISKAQAGSRPDCAPCAFLSRSQLCPCGLHTCIYEHVPGLSAGNECLTAWNSEGERPDVDSIVRIS